MKKSVLAVVIILTLVLGFSLLSACGDTNTTEKEKGKYDDINSALASYDGVSEVKHTLVVKAGDNEVHSEKTSYTVDGDNARYASEVKTFNSDMWSDGDYTTEEESGSISLAEVKGKLYQGLKLSDEIIVGFEEIVEEESIKYTFELKDKSIMFKGDSAKLESEIKVVIEAVAGKIKSLTMEYLYEGYSVESKYTIKY